VLVVVFCCVAFTSLLITSSQVLFSARFPDASRAFVFDQACSALSLEPNHMCWRMCTRFSLPGGALRDVQHGWLPLGCACPKVCINARPMCLCRQSTALC
jgi:hypothetical protein